MKMSLINNYKKISCLLFGLGSIGTAAHAAVPPAPILSSTMKSTANSTQNLVEIKGEPGRAPYKDTVVMDPAGAAFIVDWTATLAAENQARYWRVMSNGHEIYRKNLNTQSTSLAEHATVHILKAGQHSLSVELCNASNRCGQSEKHTVTVHGTDGHDYPPLSMDIDHNSKHYPSQKSGTFVAAYIPEWGQYGRKYTMANIPAHNLTHLFYAFIPICGKNESLTDANSQKALQLACTGLPDYSVVIHDQWGGFGSPLPGTSGTHAKYKGLMGQMMSLKKAYPHLKLIPSIGGWTLSDEFFAFNEKKNRDIFIASLRQMLITWQVFDGIDIDWEYPGGGGLNKNLGDKKHDGAAFVALMKEIRVMLNELSTQMHKPYELSAAVGATESKINVIDYSQLKNDVDHIMLMTYDFYGAWSNELGHQAALDCGSHVSHERCEGTHTPTEMHPAGPEPSAKSGVDAIIKQGFPPEKVVIGAAMYGRGWKGVTRESMTDPTKPITGKGQGALPVNVNGGIWEPGVIDYKAIANDYLKRPSVHEYYDEQAEAPYLWDEASGDLITYDNPRSVIAKAKYIREKHLAGFLSWSIDSDNGDITNAMQEGLLHDVSHENSLPESHAGNNQTVSNEHPIELDGKNSKDTDGHIVKYCWSQLKPANNKLLNGKICSEESKIHIDVESVTEKTKFTFRLTVKDNENAKDSDKVKVTVKPGHVSGHHKPHAIISGAGVGINEAKPGEVLQFEGGTSTAEGAQVESYTWHAALKSDNHEFAQSHAEHFQFTVPHIMDTTDVVAVTLTVTTTHQQHDTATHDVTITMDGDSGQQGDHENYEAGKSYQPGDHVKASDGNIYQCREYPEGHWCTLEAYDPAGHYGKDAWMLVE